MGIINKGPILDRKNTILESILVEIAENEGKKGSILVGKKDQTKLYLEVEMNKIYT